jgi:putative DNA primase/helicase
MDSPVDNALASLGFTTREVAPEAASPRFSDDALALSFTTKHEHDLLHVADWNRWLHWDGARWVKDRTTVVFDLVRSVCRLQANLAEGNDHLAMTLASRQKVAAVEALARSDRRHARTADDFDADPWALNTPGGVVDLRTGKLRPHSRTDHHTKITAVAPGGDCPRWKKFLHEITLGDEQAVAYLQRWAGYMLTGETREHAFIFVYGPGGNGKSVLANTLAGMLGDYAAAAPMETFMATPNDRHPTDMAGLRGARLVLAQETEAGRALAEAKIKALTGGDKISARFMRGDFFEFTPQFKLMMVGNHRPELKHPDEAMRRRLHLLPLTYRPPAPDRLLADQLRAEMPGILAWAIKGCLIWQRDRLGMAEVVRQASAEYFAEQDVLAQWIAERTEPDPGSSAAAAAMFRDWSEWAQKRGQPPGSLKGFIAEMERLAAKKRTKAGVVFPGIRLKPSDTGVF